jgi:hypothetical protein
VIVLLFGGGGAYYGPRYGWGGYHYGGIGIVGIILIVLLVWLLLGRGGPL